MDIAQRIQEVKLSILQAETIAQRTPGTVKLLAVSKWQGIDKIQQAYQAGLSAFGESYLQEAETKIKALSSLSIEWHFIGPIQSNKTKKIACNFSWVHSVCRKKIADQLHEFRPISSPPLNICLQVNLDVKKEAGVMPEALLDLAAYVLTLPRLRLRGLMVIPSQFNHEEEQYREFLKVNAMLTNLNDKLGLTLDTLSMGMSDDIQAAIRAGSTMVRIGRAIFGERIT
jgi:pyridoxal phosphate enzyme (YggS family)